MKRFILGSLLVVLSACGPVKTTTVYTPVIDINLAMQSPQPNRFVGLEYGIRVNVQDGRSIGTVLKKHDNYLITPPKETVYPEVISFVSESTRRYMRTLGFNLDADISTDYMMNLRIFFNFLHIFSKMVCFFFRSVFRNIFIYLKLFM